MEALRKQIVYLQIIRLQIQLQWYTKYKKLNKKTALPCNQFKIIRLRTVKLKMWLLQLKHFTQETGQTSFTKVTIRRRKNSF